MFALCNDVSKTFLGKLKKELSASPGHSRLDALLNMLSGKTGSEDHAAFDALRCAGILRFWAM